MLQKYKEILAGLLFGIVAVVLDTAMDAAADGNSLTDELGEHPRMVFYRLVFILLGLLLGWLLWRGNRAEREFRRATETLQHLRQQCGNQGLLVGAALQTLLTRTDLGLSAEAQQLLQEAYQRCHQFQTLVEANPPRST